MKKSQILFVLCFLLFYEPASGGVTGKIAGRITDFESGNGLAGVNVFIKGTSMGVATDNDGYYVILNVPPGTYTQNAYMIGYTNVATTNIVVVIDQTTTIDVQMELEVLGLDEVTVVAERPVVVKDISNSQLNIDSKTIESMPIKSVNEVLTLQAGIESGSRGIIVRGGGANQTVFMVDGLSQNDERSNYPYSAVSLSSVEEIQIQTGGFNAEYSQARSGIVNVVTKEGGRQKYGGTVSFRYSPAAKKHFGISVYDPHSYFNRPYFDPDVMWTGTQNGAWDSYTQSQYPKFEGWNAISEATLNDDNPDNDLTPAGAKRLFEWYRRRQGDIKKPDYIIDLGFGGPIPLLGKKLGNMRFYLSHFREQEMFVFPLSRDNYGENHTQLKLTADISPSMKVTFTGLYGEVHSVSPYDWITTPTGYVMRSQDEVANLTNSSARGRSIPFMPGYFSPSLIYRNIYGIKFTHALGPRALYEIKLQYKHNKHNTYQMADRDTTRRFDPVPGYFVDEAPYGYSGYGSTGPGSVHLGGWMNLGRDSTVNSTTTFSFDFTSQVGFRNQIKTGVEFVHNDYDIESSTVSPSNTFWNRTMVYHIFPFRIGLYVQDKLEFEGFIANLGLRLDYSDANTKSYILEDYDQFYSKDLGYSIESDAPYENSKSDLAISPRLGISHPITEDSKLYFNYGHFRSEPFSSYRFRLQRENSGNVKFIGDPNIELEKTVAYELGYDHNILDMLLVKIAGYYKDINNQPGWILYRGLSDVSYNRAANNNYEDIRGLEITVTKRLGRWISGFINYTYDVRTSGYFGLREYNEDPNEQRDYLSKKPEQTRRHPRPFARVNLDFHTPIKFGPNWMGFYPIGNWDLNILADWRTGRYETYNPNDIPGVVDDIQWKDWYNVDLRISKVSRVSTFNIQFYLDVSNVFNFKYMSVAGFADRIDKENYLASLNFSWEEGIEKGNDRVGDYRPESVTYDPLEPNPDNDPEIVARNNKRKKDKSYVDMPNITSFTFLNPRDITFGIRINF